VLVNRHPSVSTPEAASPRTRRTNPGSSASSTVVLAPRTGTGLVSARGTLKKEAVQVHVALGRQAEEQGQVILTFGDEPLTNTVSTLCPRCFATTPRRLLLGKDGHQRPGHD
jgi:hypothetical protein